VTHFPILPDLEEFLQIHVIALQARPAAHRKFEMHEMAKVFPANARGTKIRRSAHVAAMGQGTFSARRTIGISPL
jgi:hypothetical protein